MAFNFVTSTTHKIDDYNVSVILAGGAPVPLLSLGDDSEQFSYERDGETWNKKHDCQGSAHWSYNPERGGKVMLKTLHTNQSSNLILQGLLAVVSPVGEIINPTLFDLIIADNQGNIVIRANKCRIERQPNGSRGKEVGTIEWSVMASELLINESGLTID